MSVSDKPMSQIPPTVNDIGKPITYWPWNNKTEEGILKSYNEELGFIFVELPSGKVIQALGYQVHRGHFG